MYYDDDDIATNNGNGINLLIIITVGNYSECRMVRKQIHADMANMNKKLINKTDHSRSNSSMRKLFTQSIIFD